jgi:hypothetical protein
MGLWSTLCSEPWRLQRGWSKVGQPKFRERNSGSAYFDKKDHVLLTALCVSNARGTVAWHIRLGVIALENIIR